MSHRKSESMEKPHPIDTLGDVEVFQRMVQFFGPQRFMELLGWSVVFGLVSEVTHKGNPAALRNEMAARGLNKSAMYRALADLRRFGVSLEEEQDAVVSGRGYADTMHVVRRLSTLKTA